MTLHLSRFSEVTLHLSQSKIIYIDRRIRWRPETVFPPICDAKMYENPIFLSPLFWRTPHAQPRVRPCNIYQLFSNLDASWSPGCNLSSKTCLCKSPWKLKKIKKLKKIRFFQNVFKFQGDLQTRVFEVRLQPSNQKTFKLLKQFIGKDYMGVHAVAAVRQIEDLRS